MNTVNAYTSVVIKKEQVVSITLLNNVLTRLEHLEIYSPEVSLR